MTRSLDSTFSRRDWLRYAGLGLLGASGSGWFPLLADDLAKRQGRSRSVILLWMSGGPSQLDTFDPKPEHKNGGEFKPIDTSVPGIQICQHLPKLAQQMEHLSLVRSMSTKEGDHGRATYLLRTGYLPQGPVKYPTLGASLSKELGQETAELPNFVSIAPQRFLSPAAFGPGFLGPKYAPLTVGNAARGGRPGMAETEQLTVKNLSLPKAVTADQFDSRLELLKNLESDFQANHPGLTPQSHRNAYQQAVKMMRSETVKAFQLDEEPAELRDAYGRNNFGQGCLLARRLVERNVPFIEVTLSEAANQGGIGWDTHTNNFPALTALCGVLDAAWSTLLTDLKSRGLLESTLIVWMGEFGRTPVINGNAGRDHFPVAWSTVLSGGGIRGGQVVGQTAADGMTVKDKPIATADLLATVCQAVGVDHLTQNVSNVGRPIRLVDLDAKPLQELLAATPVK
ncbi:MAG: DUF1501 domain-containing protein [Planctomycetota bacterium]